MKTESFSKDYKVRHMTIDDVKVIYDLSIGNPLYFKHCPPLPTLESIIEDLRALPKGKSYDDKHYIGFFKGESLVAVMDLIEGYPGDDICFIGFFMMDRKYQGRGIGSKIVDDVCTSIKDEGYKSMRLAWVYDNPQAKHFWLKNGFEVYKDTDGTDGNGNPLHLTIGERKL